MFKARERSVSLLLLLLGLVCPGDARADVPVVINEFLASNLGEMGVDPQGQADDWIELYNCGDAAVDVGGMYLTDDLRTSAKWQIPTGDPALTTIPAGEFLVIWADGDVGDSGLHANFSLSAGGEDLALVDRDGLTIVDGLTYDQQLPDVSYGRYPDGSDAWCQMTFPSMGMQNFLFHKGVVAKPAFDVEHGFCQQEILVTITCATEGATIFYTIDGGEPYFIETMRAGIGAVAYKEPVRIGKTSCLRAVAIKSGWMGSPTATATYILVADVIGQSPTGASPGRGWPTGGVNGQVLDYGMDPDVVNDPRYKDLMDDALLAIPVISLVTDFPNLFDAQNGIYVNALVLGMERPVSVELIYPDGTQGFQIDAGMRIRGGYSRNDGNPKHAFRLFFRAEYGQSKLKYPLFGDEGADEFDSVDLRTSQNYSWSFEGGNSNSHDTFVREVFSRDTQRDMGRPYTRSRYYHLYINGQYWGLFQSQERPEASFAESYFGGAKEDYDVVKSQGGGGEGYDIEATDGSLDAWRSLWEASRSGFNNDQTYYRVQGLNPDGTPNPAYPRLLDVDNLIDYMLCTYYVGDPDGPVSAWARVANNFFAIYSRANPDGFKFFRHDAEHSLDNVNENRLFAPTTTAVGSSFNQSNPLWMHTHLILHPEYRMRFADRVYEYFFNDGVLTPERCADRFMARAQEIETAIIAESARWGDAKRSKPRTKDDDWLPDINRMVANYFPLRTGLVFNQFKSQSWYPSIDPPAFSQHGGHVPAGFSLQMQSAPVTQSQVVVAENAAKRALVPTAEIVEAWKGGGAFDDSSWKPAVAGFGGVGYERSFGYQSLISLDVGSQMYNVNTSCYIRIPFTLASDPSQFTSLTLKVRYDDGFIAYLNGTEVHRIGLTGMPRWNSASELNVEAGDPESFSIGDHVHLLRQGQNVLAIHGLNTSRNSSDFLITVSLEAEEIGLAQSAPVYYTLDGVDPRLPGGAPNATHAKSYTGPIAMNTSAYVKARILNGTTWSALNEAVFAVGPVAETLRISEIMYHPADTGNPDDPNAEYIELTNIGAAAIDLNMVTFTNGVDFTFPSFPLAPDGYCLVVKDIAAFEGRYGPGLPVVGQYTGSLNNAGERIELVDAAGRVIHDFRYDDNWYKTTDGDGFSLTLRDPATADPNDLGKNCWRPSTDVGGSPGSRDNG